MDDEAVWPEGGTPPLAAQLAMDVVESRVHERLFGAPIHDCTIGRFEVLGPAGAGGMGVVFAARDPQLDRRVAIKLVTIGTHGTERSQLRLLAEAQTMARLSHPNICAVHEVGTYEGGIYLAMEYIEGETLERWLSRDPPPSLAAAIDVFVQAGRGLAAAHRAGVVHRDFKPANAMIDHAGRVRVLDFGLAIDDDEQARTEDPDEVVHESGLLGGTPLYMAPEQHSCGHASARSDQYSFCVSLWRALYGEHPFDPQRTESGNNRRARAQAVPRWLRRVLARGLEVSPARRWPSMEALVDALTGGQLRARRRRVLAGAGVLALGATAVVGFEALDVRSRELACAQAGAQLSAAWDESARARVIAAMRATGASYADSTVDHVLPRLDAHAASLRDGGAAACEAKVLEERWTDDTHARALWCLELGQLELEALLGQLEHADPRMMRDALYATTRLSDVAPCLDLEHLDRLPQPPVEQLEEIRSLRGDLVRATALEQAGRYAEGLGMIEHALTRAEPVGWPPLVAALATEKAVLLERQGSFEPARIAAEAGYLEAARAGEWQVAARASSLLVMITGARMSQTATGLMWSEHAAIAEGYAGDPQHLLEALRFERLAHLYDEAGDYVQARAALERAMALTEQVQGPDHPGIESHLVELANLALRAGELARARGLYERAIAMQTAALGAEHPFVGQTQHNLGWVHMQAGELEAARAAFQRAIDIGERGIEPSDLGMASGLISLAAVESATGAHDQAQARLERARPIIEAAHGREHPMYALVLSELGNVHYERGRYREAGALYEQALAIEERTLGPRHVNVSVSLTALGNVLVHEGEHERAAEVLMRALAISEDVLGPEHSNTATMLSNLAGVYCATGDRARALPLLERAAAIFEREPGDQQGEGDAHARLAELLLPRDPNRAVLEAERAVRGFRTFQDEAGEREAQQLVARASKRVRR